MTIMNAYYAHESQVGDVFDVATWSPSRSVKTGLFGIIVGVVMILATVFLYKPELVLKHVKAQPIREMGQEVRKLHQTHPRGMQAGTAFAGFVAWVFTAAGVAFFLDANGHYFLRCGPGGVSLRVPDGVNWRTGFFTSHVLERDLTWDEIERLTVVQHKQFGALSRNAGNLAAVIELHLRDGKSHTFSADQFREAAYIIHDRINEATQMTAWQGESYEGRELLAV